MGRTTIDHGPSGQAQNDLWALAELAKARRLQDWMFSVLAPTTAGRMAEIGAGIGTFSMRLLDAGATHLLLLEPEPTCVGELRRRFGEDHRIEVAAESIPDSPVLLAHESSLSYALCQNVLEHIEDDSAALRAVVSALEPGGEVVVLVPAHPALFGRLDREFGHFRRYTRDSLRQLIRDAGADLTSMRSFNLLGVPGWWLAGHSSAVNITGNSLKVYELLVRFWRPIEERLRPRAGLSLVARARRPS
jgi:SAM-dependent methyltransferase